MDPTEASSVNGEQPTPAAAPVIPGVNLSKTPSDVNKQERIERYIRMTIQNQAECLLARNNASNVRWSHYIEFCVAIFKAIVPMTTLVPYSKISLHLI